MKIPGVYIVVTQLAASCFILMAYHVLNLPLPKDAFLIFARRQQFLVFSDFLVKTTSNLDRYQEIECKMVIIAPSRVFFAD